MSPCTSLPRSSPRPGGSPWEEPTRPRVPLCRAESSPRRGLGRVPGRARASNHSGHCRSARCARRGRGENRRTLTEQRPPGWIQNARRAKPPRCRRNAGASLNVAPGRGRGCRPLPPTASPLAAGARPAASAAPGDPSPRAPSSARQEVGAEQSGSSRGRGQGGRTRNFSSGWRLGPATGIPRLAARRGTGATSRRCELEPGVKAAAAGGGLARR